MSPKDLIHAYWFQTVLEDRAESAPPPAPADPGRRAMMIDPDRQCDWLAEFATAPNWNTAAARAVASANLCRNDIQTNEAELEGFSLSKHAGERSKRALWFANAVRTKNWPLAMAFDLLALSIADPADDIRDTVNRVLDLVEASETAKSDEATHRLRVDRPGQLQARHPLGISSRRQKCIGKMSRFHRTASTTLWNCSVMNDGIPH